MAITFKKRDDLEKMMENFATLPPIETTPPPQKEEDRKESKES